LTTWSGFALEGGPPSSFTDPAALQGSDAIRAVFAEEDQWEDQDKFQDMSLFTRSQREGFPTERLAARHGCRSTGAERI
jgi:hypothetical protein